MLKRYLVFTYNQYYPSGGMEDCVLITDDYQAAMQRAKEYVNETNILEQMDYVQVYDVVDNQTVYEFEREDEVESATESHLHHQVECFSSSKDADEYLYSPLFIKLRKLFGR